MIYCRNAAVHEDLLEGMSPIPNSLLQMLFCRGLGIWVLGPNREEILTEQLRINGKDWGFSPSKRNFYEHAKRRIIIHEWALPRAGPSHNVILHELGHAFDFLFGYENGQPLSRGEFTRKALEKTPELDDHVSREDKKNSERFEHFATCFEAYFNPPVAEKKEHYHCVNDLHPRTYEFFKYLLKPFESYDEQRKEKEFRDLAYSGSRRAG